MPKYQIRLLGTDRYSNGIITKPTSYLKASVNWQTKGKVWNTERAVKEHLVKYIRDVGPIDNLEIIEIIQVPTKPAVDWVDAKMLMKILKK